MKTSELIDMFLDWAVAKCVCENPIAEFDYFFSKNHGNGHGHYSTNWAQGGPIVEREGISWHCGNKSSWHAYAYGSVDNFSGPTPLIAAMRCYVASKLGEEIDIPKELQ